MAPKDSNDIEKRIDQAAVCAGIPQKSRSRFSRMMRMAINEAWRAIEVTRKPIRARDVRPYFVDLRAALDAMQASSEKRTASSPNYQGEAAGAYFSATIAPRTIGDLIEAVDRAERSATTNKRTRLPQGRSASTTAGFVNFVHMLYSATRNCGGHLTSHRGGKMPITKGSFVDVLDALRPCVPAGFIPSSQHALQDTFQKVRSNFRITR